MDADELERAVAAASATAAALGLPADDATVLHHSNRAAVRLAPCDTLVRVAPMAMIDGAELEVDIAPRLAATSSPIAALDPRVEPRVHRHGDFVLTFWTYHQPVPPLDLEPAEYARALELLHAGMREVEGPTQHFTDRVEDAHRTLVDHDRSPAIPDADRRWLLDALHRLTDAVHAHGADEQLLHGEPHAGNVLRAEEGVLFVDLETCCRGPVEFDVAHAPVAVGEHYAGVDHALLRDCRLLSLALITTWRWDRDDQFPDGRRLGIEWLDRLRADLDG